MDGKSRTIRGSVSLVLLAFVLGILAWAGFGLALEKTNTEAFCISCHEMRDFAYAEYLGTRHQSNRSGVRATCADCHVPQQWWHKLQCKIKATGELYHKLLGTIDTRDKYEARRLHMAQKVWQEMLANDSRECRNCHDAESMNLALQSESAQIEHEEGLADGMTCIECHKGIAHALPDMSQASAE